MAVPDPRRLSGGAGQALAGATILQAVPALEDDRIGRSALDLALGLLRAGARAIVAGGGGPLVGELQAVGGEWMEFGFTATRRWARRRHARALRDLLAAERVDLVHVHGAEIARDLLAGAWRASVPLAATYYGLPGRAASSRFRSDPLARADAILAPSQFAADLIVRRHGVAADRIGVIAHGIDTVWFDPAAVRADRIAALRSAWRVHPDERIVLAPGRPAGSPEHLTLVDAARILVNGGLRDVVFVVLERPAAGEEPDALQARIAAQGLAAVVRCVGRCSDMPAAYAAADLVVLSAERGAAFEETAAEALAMARPVIASGIGALPETVLAPPRVAAAQRTGWLTKPRDALDLARALAAALALDDQMLAQLCARARAFAERKFSPARICEATLAVYAALLARGR